MGSTENTETTDVSKVKFTSTVFPTKEDMELWHSLSFQEKYAVIMGDIKESLDGSPAVNAGKEEILAEVLDEMRQAN